MSLHKEISFETEICEHLANNGWLYEANDAALYDRTLALFPSDVLAWVQTTQADFDTDVKDSVVTTAAGDVILLSGGSVPIGGRITNPSFEGGSLTG